jgi:hypothetical protein
VTYIQGPAIEAKALPVTALKERPGHAVTSSLETNQLALSTKLEPVRVGSLLNKNGYEQAAPAEPGAVKSNRAGTLFRHPRRTPSTPSRTSTH